MVSGSSLSRSRQMQDRSGFAGHGSSAGERTDRSGDAATALPLARIPAGVLASAASGRCGEYDARRLRSQREIIRDVMLSAAESDTWLTLGELRALTRYGEASISAQLRHLRKAENGGFDVGKRHREDAGTGAFWRGWARGVRVGIPDRSRGARTGGRGCEGRGGVGEWRDRKGLAFGIGRVLRRWRGTGWSEFRI